MCNKCVTNYATKADFKNASGFDISDYAKKTDLANLKSDVDKLDIAKLETTPAGLSKLSNVVKNDVAKKTEYTELVKKLIKLILLILAI